MQEFPHPEPSKTQARLFKKNGICPTFSPATANRFQTRKFLPQKHYKKKSAAHKTFLFAMKTTQILKKGAATTACFNFNTD